MKYIQSKKVVYDGIEFVSKLEGAFYLELKKRNILTTPQPYAFTILEPFEAGGVKYKGATYTPDFFIEIKGVKIYIDIKGFIGDNKSRFYYKYITKVLKDKYNVVFYVVKFKKSKWLLYSSRYGKKCKDIFDYIYATKDLPML